MSVNKHVWAPVAIACLLFGTGWRAAEPAPPPQGEGPVGKPSNVTAQAWRDSERGSIDLLVFAHGLPDLTPARSMQRKEDKTRFVVESLIAHADRAQAALRHDLDQRGALYRVLWINNSLVISGASRDAVAWLGARADVALVDVDRTMGGLDARRATAWPRYGDRTPLDIGAAQAIEWGVQRVNAPAVWALGFRGQGVVVADLDTGIEWTHPALKPQYRGWNGAAADHNFNWWDATAAPAAPVDDHGHGTHTTGTLIGDDGGANQIGVAPGARWIGCKNMLNGVGSVARYTDCFQFALAPTDLAGANPDPAKAADVTSNSWGCDPTPPWSEAGCDVPSALVTVTQVLRDAGVMVVASAGNNGSSCSTVMHAPGTLDQAMSVGALSSSNTIAGFSSRGPSSFTGKMKPNVSAPGVSVRSSTPGNNYGAMSGTSMAAPHVAGTVALLWSAAPDLRGRIGDTVDVLERTATPLYAPSETCGGVPGSLSPNNTFGYGLVNAQAAVSDAMRLVITASGALTAAAVTPMPARFSIELSNQASFTRTGVVVTATAPAGTTLITATGDVTITGDALAWSIGDLAPGATAVISLLVQPAQFGPVTLSDYRAGVGGVTAPGFAGQPVTVRQYGVLLPLVLREMPQPWPEGGDGDPWVFPD